MIPAQLTSRLMPLIAARAAAIAALTCDSTLTSHLKKDAPICCGRGAPAAFLQIENGGLAARGDTRAATARPNPDAPPVTTANVCLNFIACASKFASGCRNGGQAAH